METESDTHIHDDHNLDNLDDVTLSPKDKKKKKSLKKDSSSESESESESESSSSSESEEKPKKTAAKKTAKKEEDAE